MTRCASMLGLVASCVSPTVATTSETTTTSSTSASSSSSGDATTDAPTAESTSVDMPACDPEMVLPPRHLVLGEPLGPMARYDMNRDGELDLVGGRVVIMHDESAVVIAPDLLKPDFGVPGNFTGEASGDMVYSSDSVGLLVVPDVIGEGVEPITTAAPFAEDLDVGDFDADGTDDLLLQLPRGEAIELWRGQGDGTFARVASLEIGIDDAIILGGHVAASRYTGEVLLYEANGETLVEVDAHTTFRLLKMTPVTVSPGPGILSAWWEPIDDGPAFENGVGILVPGAPEWQSWTFHLGEGWVHALAPTDLDDDGDLDLVVAFNPYPDAWRFEFLCASADGYTRCGVMPSLHTPSPSHLGVLANPLRVVLSTSEDTLSIEIGPVPCP